MGESREALFELPLSELDGEGPKYVWVGGTEIVLFKHRGGYYAFRSICPHMGGQLTLDRRSGKLACPWHPLSFSLESGQSDHCRFKKVVKYTTLVRGEKLVVSC